MSNERITLTVDGETVTVAGKKIETEILVNPKSDVYYYGPKRELCLWLAKSLGSGSFGQVFLGLDLNTGKKYVVKRVDKKIGGVLGDDNLSAKQIQEEELRLWNELILERNNLLILNQKRHPNIVNLIYTAQLEDPKLKKGTFDIVMNHIPMKFYFFLQEIAELDSQTEQLELKLDMLNQLMKGLSYMHSKDIDHHDFNPKNMGFKKGKHKTHAVIYDIGPSNGTDAFRPLSLAKIEDDGVQTLTWKQRTQWELYSFLSVALIVITGENASSHPFNPGLNQRMAVSAWQTQKNENKALAGKKKLLAEKIRTGQTSNAQELSELKKELRNLKKLIKVRKKVETLLKFLPEGLADSPHDDSPTLNDFFLKLQKHGVFKKSKVVTEVEKEKRKQKANASLAGKNVDLWKALFDVKKLREIYTNNESDLNQTNLKMKENELKKLVEVVSSRVIDIKGGTGKRVVKNAYHWLREAYQYQYLRE